MAMATSLKFDELNRLDYRDFFGKMYITPKQMRKRIDLALEIEGIIFFLFDYYEIYKDTELDLLELKADVKEKLTAVVEKKLKLDPYITEHIDKAIDEVVDATERHADKDKPEDYWTSAERATIISANEANALSNYDEYREARASGKKRKRWITELDDKVRFTHTLAEGQTVDIDGLFLVGGSQMRFPKDDMYDPAPEEVINCRCAVQYI